MFEIVTLLIIDIHESYIIVCIYIIYLKVYKVHLIYKSNFLNNLNNFIINVNNSNLIPLLYIFSLLLLFLFCFGGVLSIYLGNYITYCFTYNQMAIMSFESAISRISCYGIHGFNESRSFIYTQLNNITSKYYI